MKFKAFIFVLALSLISSVSLARGAKGSVGDLVKSGKINSEVVKMMMAKVNKNKLGSDMAAQLRFAMCLQKIEKFENDEIEFPCECEDIYLEELPIIKEMTYMSTCGSKNDDDNADKAIEGGEGDDKLVGMGGEDEMYGDEIWSKDGSKRGGDDKIDGGEGDDTIFEGGDDDSDTYMGASDYEPVISDGDNFEIFDSDSITGEESDIAAIIRAVDTTKSISETILANAKEIICHSKLSEYFDGETDEFPCGCSGMCNAYADSTACVLESWKCFWKEMHETRRGIIENFSAR